MKFLIDRWEKSDFFFSFFDLFLVLFLFLFSSPLSTQDAPHSKIKIK